MDTYQGDWGKKLAIARAVLEGKTYAATAQVYGLSRERARQIFLRVMRECRKELRRDSRGFDKEAMIPNWRDCSAARSQATQWLRLVNLVESRVENCSKSSLTGEGHRPTSEPRKYNVRCRGCAYRASDDPVLRANCVGCYRTPNKPHKIPKGPNSPAHWWEYTP